MAGTATNLHVLDCGSTSCDLTWLLLKPGRSIIFGHDAEQLWSLRRSPDGHYT